MQGHGVEDRKRVVVTPQWSAGARHLCLKQLWAAKVHKDAERSAQRTGLWNLAGELWQARHIQGRGLCRPRTRKIHGVCVGLVLPKCSQATTAGHLEDEVNSRTRFSFLILEW